MRLFWVGIFVTGLFLIGLGTYDRRQVKGQSVSAGGLVTACEDGTPMPNPNATPPPKIK
ncbi:MAG TPA: hypothetical protein VMT70_12245 [Vicinamibacteria bacterium]|nr:hypothetical protein [Vicinamibacteria bacterium]